MPPGMRRLACATLLCILIGCGDDIPQLSPSIVTDELPLITRIAPATARGGDTVALFGIGFSNVPGETLVFVGNQLTQAATYALAPAAAGAELETLTFVVPANTAVGDTTVRLMINNFGSNAVTFTVSP